MQIEEDIESGVSRTRDALVPYLVRGGFVQSSEVLLTGEGTEQVRLRHG